ncbi:peroxiredoxin [Thioclava sp. NG1]|uniref:peroxiredoxin n=1 Tax=unclassified Thioclava TaxID=2621713 RepID=UPI000B541AB8|nr:MULTISPECIES: peroxiredoxin [unclassified Thioclava]OWY12618.1 peroxiredoxin [Thioclava sp. F34-6]PWE49694.1 peroxiredoxin [Thioclava sp. NG1]
MIETGEKAPDFTLPATGGKSFETLGNPITEEGNLTLSAFAGRPVVLYFYPKDNTPGCTTEALDFTRLAPDFAAAGAVVVGISKDSLKKHENFCAKHDLGIYLASDDDAETCEAYGVWAEKSMYGKTFWGIVRATFLIDADGKVAKVWPKVKVKGHAEEVLGAVRELC